MGNKRLWKHPHLAGVLQIFAGWKLALPGVFLLFFVQTALAERPWPGVEFSEVRAYAWEGKLAPDLVILPDMKLAKGVTDDKGAALTPDEIKSLRAAVTGKHPAYSQAFCYSPRHAFVFYDAEGKPTAFVEVCLECMGHRIEPDGASEKIDLVALAAILDAHKLPLGSFADLAAFKKAFKDWSAKWRG